MSCLRMERGGWVALCPQVRLFDPEEGLCGGLSVPVKGQPVTLECTGELGPGLFQALQEVFLMERADPRGSLGVDRKREREAVMLGSQRARPTPAQATGKGRTFHGVMVLCRGIRLAM